MKSRVGAGAAPIPRSRVHQESVRTGLGADAFAEAVGPENFFLFGFSSDRSIREYCRDIWHVTPITGAAEART